MGRTHMLITLFISGAILISAFIVSLIRIKKQKNFGSALFGISIFLFFIGGFIFVIYTSTGNYDRYGNRYSNYNDVIFYTKSGQIYKLVGEYYGESVYVNIKDKTDVHRETCTFFTSDGFLVFDDENQIYIIKTKFDDMLSDENGNKVYQYAVFDWLGNFSKYEDFEFFQSYIFNPYFEQNGEDALTIVGIWLLGVILFYLIQCFRKQVFRRRYVPYVIVGPVITLMLGGVFSVYLTPVLFIVMITVVHKTVAYDIGMLNFQKEHGFDNARTDEFIEKMKIYFPDGYEYKYFKQFADEETLTDLKRKMLLSFLVHFFIWLGYIIGSYLFYSKV